MEIQDILLHIWLCSSFSYGSAMPCKILKAYSGNLKPFFDNLESEIKKFKITEKSAEKLNKKDLESARKILDLCRKLKIKIVTYYSEKFPSRLKEINDCPIVLYYYGNINISFTPCVSVIGTRNCDKIGLENARTITKELVKYGITTVSGCAKGIDKSIHLNTLREKGNTIAILGTPLDSKYPYENCELKRNIVKNNGLLISEYPPKIKTYAWHFPLRNRIISAMADCVVVVQSKEKSGTILTARKALEYKKKLFCIPPPNIFDENSKGVKKCLEEGASLLMGIEDILKLYENSKYSLKKKEETKKEIDIPEKFKVLMNVIGEERRLDEILRLTKYKTNETLIMLTQLELLNLVKKTTTGYKKAI